MKKPEIIRFKPEFEKELLRLGVKTRFLKNRIEYCNKIGKDITDLYDRGSFNEFICIAFIWSLTPEGVDFWNSIANGIKPD
jgi:hypothetical protein